MTILFSYQSNTIKTVNLCFGILGLIKNIASTFLIGKEGGPARGCAGERLQNKEGSKGGVSWNEFGVGEGGQRMWEQKCYIPMCQWDHINIHKHQC